MNDVKDILNKIKLVPEELQDEVLKNIKKDIEKEINKSCNPIVLLIQRLKELGFGLGVENSIKDRKIIRIIINCVEELDFFCMNPIYCESVEKTKEYDDWTYKYKVNGEYQKFIKNEVEDILKADDTNSEIKSLITDIARKSHQANIDVIEDSYWIYKDEANWEMWMQTTKQLAQEMFGWFNDCFYIENDDDVRIAWKILNELEKSFPEKD